MRRKTLFVFLFLLFIVIILSLAFKPKLSPAGIVPNELLVKTEGNYSIEIKEIASIIVDDKRIPRVNILIKSKSFNETLVNFTFKTPGGGFKFFKDGIFLYGYYSGWDAGIRSEAVFLDYNLTVKWWKIYEYNVSSYELIYFNPKTAQEYKDYILMLGSITRGFDKTKGILFFNKTNGELTKILSIHGIGLAVINKKAYVLSSKDGKYYLTLYDLDDGKPLKTIKTSFEVIAQPIDPFLGLGVKFIEGDKYLGVFFWEYPAVGGIYEKICVYSLNLKLVDCIEFSSHDVQDKNKIVSAVIIDDYLIIERNNGRKEIYKING